MTFKLNMSDEVANAKDYEVLPSGIYVVRIADIEHVTVKKAGENFGKPMWKLTLVVEEGEHAGKSIITQISLFQSSPWSLLSIKQLCEAVHPEYIDGNDINLPTVSDGEGGYAPDPEPWLGQIVNIQGTKFPVGSRKNNGEFREYDEFRVKYKKPTAAKANKPGVAGLPLPS